MKKSFALAFLILICAALVVLFFLTKKTEHSGQPLYLKTVNIAYVETPFNIQIIVMKERRMLEDAFESMGVTVRWHVFNQGAEQTQAMAAGSLDIAPVLNSTSVILANAAGNPVGVAALVSRPRQTFALMVRQDGPRNIRGLRGTTIAGPKGSVLHQMLIAALVKEGMNASDVNLLNMGLPQAGAALLASQVDGALQAAGLIIRNEEAGMVTLFTADGYLTPLLLTAVRPAFAENYPGLLHIFLQVQAEAYNWISANTAEAVALGSRLLSVSASDGMKLYQWSGISQTMEQSDIKALEEDVDFLYQQNMIEKKIDPNQFILPVAFGYDILLKGE